MVDLALQARSGWTSHEVITVDHDGRVLETPIWSALTKGGRIDAQPVVKMRQVEEVGWPDAHQVLFFTVGRRRKKRIVAKDGVIWELKCTPNCWRLYFYVTKESRRIVYAHAICKTTDKEDPRAALDARRRYDGVQSGRHATRPFPFPRG